MVDLSRRGGLMACVGVAGHVLGGRYRLDRHLADGGMGAIWRASDLTLGKPVAVKLMSVEGAMRADLRTRFDREAKAVAHLHSPHIVQLLDYGTDGDTPFIVMELLSGMDLLASQKYSDPWPLSEVAELVNQVARGLATAHRAGFIHRDVKPANIFLARDEPYGEVVAKLVDFGIVKWDNLDALTAANVILGSPSFMSPEQIKGRGIDARVDVWALAVVAFGLVTGEMPFVGRNAHDIAKQVVLGNRRRVEPPIPNAYALERFFARALAVDPAARFQSVEELAGELVMVVGAPSALHTAGRAIAKAVEETQKLPKAVGEDSVTNVFVRARTEEVFTSEILQTDRGTDAPPMNQPPPHPEDLEETETEGPFNPSGGGAGRRRSSG